MIMVVWFKIHDGRVGFDTPEKKKWAIELP